MSYASVAALREYLPQVPEWGQQRITLTGATGGTFTLSYEGVATSPLAYNATATQVQTALRTLAGIGANGMRVTGQPGGPWVTKFQGDLATDAAPLTASAASLTPVGATVTIAKATDALLQSCLNRATDIVRQALRAAIGDPSFDYAAYGVASVKSIQSYGGPYLQLPPHQAGSITSVKWGTYTLATTAYAETAAGMLQILTPASWPGFWNTALGSADWGLGVYTVTGVWGYGPTVPDAVQELVLELAVNIHRSSPSGGYVETVGVNGSGSVRVITGLSKQQQLIVHSVRDQLLQVSV